MIRLIRPTPGPTNSGSSVNFKSLMTDKPMLSDFRISTWVSTWAVSMGMSPSGASCCCNIRSLLESISKLACEVKLGGVVKR